VGWLAVECPRGEGCPAMLLLSGREAESHHIIIIHTFGYFFLGA
jgi:hypothetical protein